MDSHAGCNGLTWISVAVAASVVKSTAWMNGCFLPFSACNPPSSENPLAEEEGDSRCIAREKGLPRCHARGAGPSSAPGRCCAAEIALNWLGEAPLAGALEARKAAGAFAAAAREDVVSIIAHTRGERRNMVCNAGLAANGKTTRSGGVGRRRQRFRLSWSGTGL